jgi:hypothetical protein
MPRTRSLSLALGALLLAPAAAQAHAGATADVAIAAAPTAGRAAEARAADPGVIRLAVDQQRFWLGGQVESGAVDDPALCDVTGPCPAWTLEVAPGARQLRIGIDTPSREDAFTLVVTGPDGREVARADGANQFDAEAFVDAPKPGAHVVRVVPTQVSRASFRMRAKLEGADRSPAARAAGTQALLLPNLRAVPPYEFGFVAPANPLNGVYPPDTVNPPLSAAGAEPLSCAPDELAPEAAGGQGARDCLRLTSGPINVGDGPFIKRFRFAGDLAAGKVAPDTLRGPAEQVVLRGDGTTTRRPAGTYSFHTTHAHFHDDGILTYELFAVDGARLTPAGVGTKSGFCPADQLMGEWRSFTQDPAGAFGEGDTAGGSCFDPADGTLALTRGWGDVYRWQRPGQFIEFAGNPDGLYVARTTVDKSDTTLETDETDNSAYALVRIVGRRVELLERGQGLSHLDPRKEVFTGFGPASRDGVGGELPPAGAAAAVAKDGRAPRVGGLRLVRRGGRLVLRLRSSEAGRATIVVRRRGRTVARLVRRVRAGSQTVALPRALRRARGLTVAVSVRDAAGNVSAVRRR